MTSDPLVTPVTSPVALPTVPVRSLVDHIPPGVVSLRLMFWPGQTTAGPVIDVIVFTETVLKDLQPVPSE